MMNNRNVNLMTSSLFQGTLLGLAMLMQVSVQAQILNSASLSKNPVPINEEFAVVVQLTPNNNTVWCGLRVEYGDGRTQEIRVGSEGFQSLPLKLTHRFVGSGEYNIRIFGRYLSRGLKSANACEGSPISVPVKVIDPAVIEAAKIREEQVLREQNERIRMRQDEERIARERQSLEAQRKALEERERQTKERELAERERALREREEALSRKALEAAQQRPAITPAAPAARPAAPPVKPAATGF
jgi:hypothetical protein